MIPKRMNKGAETYIIASLIRISVPRIEAFSSKVERHMEGQMMWEFINHFTSCQITLCICDFFKDCNFFISILYIFYIICLENKPSYFSFLYNKRNKQRYVSKIWQKDTDCVDFFYCHGKCVYSRGWQTFSIKGQSINILSFSSYIVSVATSQLCCCKMNAATDNT